MKTATLKKGISTCSAFGGEAKLNSQLPLLIASICFAGLKFSAFHAALVYVYARHTHTNTLQTHTLHTHTHSHTHTSLGEGSTVFS